MADCSLPLIASAPVAYGPTLRDVAQRTSRHRINPNAHRGGLSTLVCSTRASDVRTAMAQRTRIEPDGGYRPPQVPQGNRWIWCHAAGRTRSAGRFPLPGGYVAFLGAGQPRKRWAPPPKGDGAHTCGDLLLRQRHVSGDLAQ